MALTDIWFLLIAVLWTGYFVLEGFDFGVGMLLRVLSRGYALAFRPDGQLLRDPADVGPGDRLRVQVSGGSVETVVAATNR